MSTDFSFGQIEAICAALNRIASDKRVAFAGRLKQLQKQGLMEESRRPGRGKAGTYTFSDLMRFVVAVELIQAGLMPQMAARLVTGSWLGLRYSVYSATFTEEEMDEWQEMPLGPETRDYYWMLTPEALREMTEEGFGKYDHMDSILAVPVEEVADRLQSDVEIGVFGEGWRMIVLHGTKITKAVVGLLEGQYRYATREQMRADLQGELNYLMDAMEDSPFLGVEEGVRSVFDRVKNQTLEVMASDAMRPRYYPSAAALERQAKKMVAKLRPYQLSYLQREEFGDKDVADMKAMTELLMQGLIVPELGADDIAFRLTPLGQAVKELTKDALVGPDAIPEFRAAISDMMDERVQRRIDALLMSDPDNPEDDEALQRWAREGGRPPLSEIKAKENARKFVQGMREATKDDPEQWEAFRSRIARIGGHYGDDQKA